MRFSQLLLLLFCTFSILTSCKKESGIDTVPIEETAIVGTNKQSLKLSDELDSYLPVSSSNQVIKHSFYMLSYNEKAEQAEWLAYELKKEYVVNNNFKRPYFIEDPKVKSASADWRNYKNSGYDKGHLCPAGDMGFDKNAYNDTFYTSNISPQDHGFNAGIWNRLEQKVRYWAVKYDGLYVVTAGVLGNSSQSIGKEKVIIPKYFYKILLNRSNGKYKMIGFLIPNAKSEKTLYSYVVAVDKIEQLTGIDFFPQLDDSVENKLERNTDYSGWIFN